MKYAILTVKNALVKPVTSRNILANPCSRNSNNKITRYRLGDQIKWQGGKWYMWRRGQAVGNRPLGRPRQRWEYIKIDI
jgi:hypothetical protein